jgi:cytidine deaminase
MATATKKFSYTITASLYNFSDLPTHDQELIHAAIKVRRNAQAPYSHYLVGAAVRCNKGTMHTGCNVERCSYSQTTHAEQNAVDSMVAHWGPTKIDVLALAGGPASSTPTPHLHAPTTSLAHPEQAILPCGHCRQIIWENCFGDGNVKILSLTPHGDVLVATIRDFLPMCFGPEQLGIMYERVATTNV